MTERYDVEPSRCENDMIKFRIPATTCLPQALSLQQLLSHNGLNSELRIGVDRVDGQFVAHAWLLFDGRVLIGGEDLANYQVIADWRAATSRLACGEEG